MRRVPVPLDQPTRFEDSDEIAELLTPPPRPRSVPTARAPQTPPAPPPPTVVKPAPRPAPVVRSAPADDLDSEWLDRQIRRPNGPQRRAVPASTPRPQVDKARTTSTTLPLPLLDDLQRARLSAEMRGDRFNVQRELNAAILDLPVDPEGVLRSMQRSRHRINFGVSTDEAGFIDEGRFTFRVTRSAEQHLAAITAGLYERLGRRVHRQDLFALAMIACVDSQSRAA